MDSPKITKSVKKYSLERIGSRKCQKIPLPIGVHLVGRSRLAHLFINSKFCNRIHCRLIVDCDSISVCVDVSRHFSLFLFWLRMFSNWTVVCLRRVRSGSVEFMWTTNDTNVEKCCCTMATWLVSGIRPIWGRRIWHIMGIKFMFTTCSVLPSSRHRITTANGFPPNGFHHP